MKIVIAGGTGFLGRPLAAALAADGHDVVILTRGAGPRRGQTGRAPSPGRPTATPARGPRRSTAPTPSSTSPASRSPAGAGRRRRSSGSSTAACARRAASSRPSRRAATPPPVFVSGSAVGYYGPRGDEVVTEDTPRRHAISSREVCVQWEAEAQRAASDRTRVVCIRTGLVLETRRRRAAADAAAVQVRRRRAGRIGPAVLAVDSSRRLDRSRAVGDPDAGRGRAAQRDGARTR